MADGERESPEERRNPELRNRLTIAVAGRARRRDDVQPLVIADFLFGWGLTITVTAVTAVTFGLFWCALPLGRRAQETKQER